MRIGILGDLDLNAVDGSSLWVQSFAEAVDRYTEHTPIIISKRRLVPSRPIPTSLARHGLQVVEPQHLNADIHGGVASLLDSSNLASLDLDVLLIRGLNAVIAASARVLPCGQLWGYVTEFDRNVVIDEGLCRRLRTAIQGVDRFLVQTNAARELLATLPGVSSVKLHVLPPMLAVRYSGDDGVHGRERRLVYGGKFAPEWGIIELHQLAQVFAAQSAGENPLPVILFGDKIHDPTPGKAFTARLEALEVNPFFERRGAVTRDEVVATLKQSLYAWAWRTPALEESTLETSSKVLEACATGCLPICYPNRQNRELLGDSYPLFALSVAEASGRLAAVDGDRETREVAQRSLAAAVKHHRDSAVIKDLFASLLPRSIIRAQNRHSTRLKSKPKLLVAGHDLKFATSILRDLRLTYDVYTQRWRGHNDPALRDRPVDTDAEVIWCEWCLGNAVHYSHHKKPEQRLVIRFHLQEFNSEYPEQVNIDNVDQIVFVNDYHREQALVRYGWPDEKLVTVPNYVDASAYFFEKPDDAYFNIGLVGCVPARKRMDRALDLIEALRKQDDRWTLWIKGKLPTEYSWLMHRPEEMAYYRECQGRIQRSRLLRDGVRHVAAGPDVPEFLSKMGWVISPSDFESFHLAVIEGAAAHVVPVIWDWDAAQTIYNSDWIVKSVHAAQRKIQEVDLERWRELGNRARCEEVSRFDSRSVVAGYLHLFAGERS